MLAVAGDFSAVTQRPVVDAGANGFAGLYRLNRWSLRFRVRFRRVHKERCEECENGHSEEKTDAEGDILQDGLATDTFLQW